MRRKALGLGKIMRRYVVSAAGVGLVLLAVNLVFFLAVSIYALDDSKGVFRDEVEQLAAGLHRTAQGYAFDEAGQAVYDEWFVWAMLLDGEGGVIWSQDLPDDVPQQYSAGDIAQFTRWYLKDYPTTVWRYGADGLLVLAQEQGSIAKYMVKYPVWMLENMLWGFSALLIINIAGAVLLALFFGYRMFRSIRPVAAAISDLSQKKPVDLLQGGPLDGLSQMLIQTSQELARQDALLEKRDQTRTEWIAGVSHDIRTPLSMVMGYAGQLEADETLTETQRQQASIIRAQSQRMKELISNLNLASRLLYGWQPPVREKVQLAALLRSTAADYLNGGLDDTYSLMLDIQTEAVTQGDAFLLRRALENLIGNSIHHNPGGCRITLSLFAEGEYAVLRIQDNGRGTAPETLAEIGKREAPEHTIKKHGMGLPVVMQIAKAHGGYAAFENAPGGGFSAAIYLPQDEKR